MAHKSAEITSSGGGQMSIYSIFERQGGYVFVRARSRVCSLFFLFFSFGGGIRSIGTSLEAYRQLTEQRGVCGRGVGGEGGDGGKT